MNVTPLATPGADAAIVTVDGVASDTPRTRESTESTAKPVLSLVATLLPPLEKANVTGMPDAAVPDAVSTRTVGVSMGYSHDIVTLSPSTFTMLTADETALAFA